MKNDSHYKQSIRKDVVQSTLQTIRTTRLKIYLFMQDIEYQMYVGGTYPLQLFLYVNFHLVCVKTIFNNANITTTGTEIVSSDRVFEKL